MGEERGLLESFVLGLQHLKIPVSCVDGGAGYPAVD